MSLLPVSCAVCPVSEVWVEQEEVPAPSPAHWARLHAMQTHVQNTESSASTPRHLQQPTLEILHPGSLLIRCYNKLSSSAVGMANTLL